MVEVINKANADLQWWMHMLVISTRISGGVVSKMASTWAATKLRTKCICGVVIAPATASIAPATSMFIASHHSDCDGLNLDAWPIATATTLRRECDHHGFASFSCAFGGLFCSFSQCFLYVFEIPQIYIMSLLLKNPGLHSNNTQNTPNPSLITVNYIIQ